MTLGYAHALIEVAMDVLKRTKDIGKKSEIRDAIAATDMTTIIGKVSWKGGPVKNVARTPLVGGQWVKGKGKSKYEMLIVNNETAPDVPTQAKPKAITY